MGWFSATIMGGDDPTDYLSILSDMLDEHVDWSYIATEEEMDDGYHSLYPLVLFKNNAQARDTVRSALVKLDSMAPSRGFVLSSEFFNERLAKDKDGQNIFLQVACSLYMAAGAPLPDDLKLEACLRAKKDDWSSRSKERAWRMTAFINAVNDYDNATPIFEQHEGLFQKIEDKLSGKSVPSDFRWQPVIE